MSIPGPKTQMELQEVHKEDEIVSFGKPEGPQTNLFEACTTVPSSKGIRSLQRLRHVDAWYQVFSHRLPGGKV